MSVLTNDFRIRLNTIWINERVVCIAHFDHGYGFGAKCCQINSIRWCPINGRQPPWFAGRELIGDVGG